MLGWPGHIPSPVSGVSNVFNSFAGARVVSGMPCCSDKSKSIAQLVQLWVRVEATSCVCVCAGCQICENFCARNKSGSMRS